jgi:hypothetical protein
VHDPDIFAISADQADFGGANFFVRARAGVTLWRRIMRSAGYGFDPLIIAEFRSRNLNARRGCFKMQLRSTASISCVFVAFQEQDPWIFPNALQNDLHMGNLQDVCCDIKLQAASCQRALSLPAGFG